MTYCVLSTLREKWLQHVQRMDTDRLPKQAPQCKPKDERTWDDRGRDGGTNFILRVKEQETRLNLQEHDDDDDYDDAVHCDLKMTQQKGRNMSSA